MKHFRNIFLWSPENHNLTYITIATKWIRKPQWTVQGQWKIRSRGTCAKQWSGYRRQCVRPKQWIKDHMCALQIHTGCIGLVCFVCSPVLPIAELAWLGLSGGAIVEWARQVLNSKLISRQQNIEIYVTLTKSILKRDLPRHRIARLFLFRSLCVGSCK